MAKRVLPSNWEKNMREYAIAVRRTVDQTTRAAGISLFTGIVRRSPVDTGRFRGNWQITAGSPSRSEVERKDKSGGSVMGEIRSKFDPRQDMYLTNNLPYAERREIEGGAPVIGSKRKPFRYGVGKGGGFIDEEIKRVNGNMKKFVGGKEE